MSDFVKIRVLLSVLRSIFCDDYSLVGQLLVAPVYTYPLVQLPEVKMNYDLNLDLKVEILLKQSK